MNGRNLITPYVGHIFTYTVPTLSAPHQVSKERIIISLRMFISQKHQYTFFNEKKIMSSVKNNRTKLRNQSGGFRFQNKF